MGLMGVRPHLDEPEHIGPGIATAFVATFYGVFTANVLCSPSRTSSKNNSKHEHPRPSTSSSRASCPSSPCDNPRIVREKLEGFLQPSERRKGDDSGEARREAA